MGFDEPELKKWIEDPTKIWTGAHESYEPLVGGHFTTTTRPDHFTIHHTAPAILTTPENGMVYTTTTPPTYYPASTLDSVTWTKYEHERMMREDETIMSSSTEDPISLRT